MVNNRSSNEASSVPQEFPATTPDELFPTNNIRFVMWETAKLTERVDGLTNAVEKLGPGFEKALDRHTADLKERLADLTATSKQHAKELGEVKSSIDTFKGAMKVLGGVYTFALVVMGAVLAWALRPVEPAAVPASAVPTASIAPSQLAAPPTATPAQ